MKRKTITLGVTLSMSALLFAGCGKEAAQVNPKDTQDAITTTEEQNLTNEEEASIASTEAIPLTYSFLYDDATRQEVSDIMAQDGIDSDTINSFMQTVTQFADTLGEMEGAHDGFTDIEDATQPFYDFEYIGMTFDQKLGFSDQNCRLTAYSLFHNFYTVAADSSFVDENDFLYGDMEILKTNDNLDFSDEDIQKYTTLFADIPTEASLDTNVHAGHVKEEWQKRGITFDADAKVQLITIMMNDPVANTIYAGHAGVLLETEEGYLLIEKLSQYTPFVASKFDSLEKLNAYLLSEVMLFQQDGASNPFIMRNDELLISM